MPRRKQEQPKRLPYSHGNEDEAGGELGEEENWFGNASDTPSEISYLDVQEHLNVSPGNKLQEEETSPESSLGSTTPIRNSLELLISENEQFKDTLDKQDALSPVPSPLLHEMGSHILHKPMSSNLRRLLEAGSISAKPDLGATEKDDSAVALGSALPVPPSSTHALQLSALARKLAAKQEQSNNFSPSNNFMWNQDIWLQNSSSCSLSPASATQKLKAAANAVRLDKSLSREEEPVRFSPYSSPYNPIEKQSASSALAALSKKVSERSLSSAHDHKRPGSTFLSLASMTSSAALLKEVAARAAGNMLVERKGQLIPGDTLQSLEVKQEKLIPSVPVEMLMPTAKQKTLKSTNKVSEEEGGKSFQCPICGLVIKRKSYWKRHMVIHTGLKSHQCPLCPFRCARKDNLKSHMKQVHQHQDRGETFHCELCPFTSSRHFSLKLHMRCHQHFPRTEVKVKEEITESEVTRTLSNETADKKKGTELLENTLKIQDHLFYETKAENYKVSAIPLKSVKEEPSDVNVISVSLTDSHVFGKRPEGIQQCAANPSEPSDLAANQDGFPLSQDISATDFLLKLSAANQRGSLTPKIKAKDEHKEKLPPDPILSPQSGYIFGNKSPVTQEPPEKSKKMSEITTASELFNQDMSCKVASELLFKLSAENKKQLGTQIVTIKEEPMDLKIPELPVSPFPSRVFNYEAVKSESSQNSPEVIPLTEIKLFTQDISVKMASELLYQLSAKVSKAQEQGKDSSELGSNNCSVSEDVFRQSPLTSKLRDPLSDLHVGPASHEAGKLTVESGTITPPWKFCEQLFPCKICGKVFGRQQTLSRHLSLHTEERRYKCHLCPYAAKCRANLNQHLTIHSVKLVSGDSEDIATAVTSKSGDCKKSLYYYSCHVCGFETEVNLQFVSHMSLHVDKEQWMFSLCCGTCNFSCMDETEMKTHVDAAHAGEKVSVPSCLSPTSESKAAPTFFSSSSSSSLSSSSALCDSVTESETLNSDFTKEEQITSFNSPIAFGGSSTSAAEEKSEKGFECIFCNFVCKTKMMYDRHLQIHLITRMYECDICHKFLKTPEQLVEHKKCHNVSTGGLKCPFCIYATNRPSAIECHLRTHYKMEFKCRICQVVKMNQLELEMHIREHRLGNHYKCDQCGYLSKTANKLIEHIRVHTGERPFHCDQCSYSCKRKDNLNLHKKLKHSPRQTLCCDECFFTTTHPFVFSRHVKKHQNGEYLEEEKKGRMQLVTLKERNAVLNSRNSRNILSPLSVMSASQALQTVALSVTGNNGISTGSALGLFGLNGISAHLSKYRNCDLSHLIPLTTLFPQNKCEATFHLSQQQTAPPGTVSPKHSFLAYLGLTEQATTVSVSVAD
ncbi:zinc finger protein 827 isoform X1 [Hemiscyllium ocellatum]|uniref:zinc finger protein 827 isoform X1 n=1 Tax=Hemiscyllium ocellatum TaxID=170820 RepID=UPI00296645F3|nr:zinc finger protein 827 isoform X1 [Hemiscyllium ocellatum]